MQESYTFDDVLLVPQYSDIKSRSEVDLSTTIGNLSINIPIISANMSSVTEFEMAQALHNAGGLGIFHRYAEFDTVMSWLANMADGLLVEPIPSIGVQREDIECAEYYSEYTKSICIDVAHGDSKATQQTIARLHDLEYETIIAGNVATGSGAKRLVDSGANVIKVGVGPGSVCTTRVVTGHGVPQLSAIMDVYTSIKGQAHIIADGGIRNSGDIVKALAAGADAVMIGGLFAGTDEAPNTNGEYSGMASSEAQLQFRGKINNNMPEGISVKVARKGPVIPIIQELCGGIRSGLSYSGCRTIGELKENAVFIRTTRNGLIEGHPHALTLK